MDDENFSDTEETEEQEAETFLDEIKQLRAKFNQQRKVAVMNAVRDTIRKNAKAGYASVSFYSLGIPGQASATRNEIVAALNELALEGFRVVHNHKNYTSCVELDNL